MVFCDFLLLVVFMELISVKQRVEGWASSVFANVCTALLRRLDMVFVFVFAT